MKNRNRYTLIGLVSIVLFGLYIQTGNWTKQHVKALETLYQSQMTPIIMVPGSSATVNRFDGMVNEINKNSIQKHSLLKVQVNNNGTMTYTGRIRQKDHMPFIVVGFENNHDGYANIKKQAAMFNQAFKELQDTYHFSHFEALGHSNGGLVYTIFFEKYFQAYADKVTPQVLMTLGTPYNFAEDSMGHKTQMLADLIAHRKSLPKELIVYSVAGTKNYTSDGLVPEQSVEASKYIFQDQVKNFTQVTITGDNAQHSDLPQNSQVISIIKQHLINPYMQRQQKEIPNKFN